MAKASVEYTDIQINLNLNENELKLLLVVLNRIGGCPHASPRKYADKIHQAIKDLNLNIDTEDFTNQLDFNFAKQGIYFK